MGSLLKTSVVAGFLLLLPAMVYCDDRYVSLDLFMSTNCTEVPTQNFTFWVSGGDSGGPWQASYTTFGLGEYNNMTATFESAILTNVTGDVVSLVACQSGLECNATGAIQIPFNLNAIGACSTAGPRGTQFDKFMIS